MGRRGAAPVVVVRRSTRPADDALPAGDAVRKIGNEFIGLFTAHKWLRWTVFWFAWFWISPTTIIPGAIAVGVGNVFYRERAVNLVTICAAYLGVWLYIALGHMAHYFSNDVLVWMGWAAVFSVVVLAARFPTLRYFLVIMICSAVSRGGYYPYRRRRWW
jgi:hypothetical protein